MIEKEYCRSCTAPILWVRTVNGKYMPLNAEPDPKGNIVLDRHDVATVLGKNAVVPVGTPIYMPHHATCSNAQQHRKAKS
jgi:hypothetical protein